MNLKTFSLLFVFLFLTVLDPHLADPSFAAEKATPTADNNLQNISPDQLDSTLATLSDEQVRKLLIEELSRDISSKTENEKRGGDLFSVVVGWLHIFDVDNEEEIESRINSILNHVGKIPDDLANIFMQFGGGQNSGTAWKNISLLLAVLLGAFIIEHLFKYMTANFRRQFLGQGVPDLNYYMRLWAGIIREIPYLIHLAIFTVTALLLFFLSPAAEILSVRYLFLAALFAILFIRIGKLLSHLFLSPHFTVLRLLPLGDETAVTFHKLVILFFSFVGISMSFIALIAELGIPREASIVIVTTLGSILMFMTAVILLSNRQPITEYILSGETIDTGSNWVIRQFASLWHIPALLYLFIVWFIFIFQQTLGVRQGKNAFLLSLLVVPLFLILDRIGHWIVTMTVTTLNIYPELDKDPSEVKNPDDFTQEQKEKLLIVRVSRFVRLAILLALGGWVMSLWGYPVPYIATITRIVFRSLVTLALALAFWKVLSDYIERKILEDEPEGGDSEDQEDEWGGAAQRGRSYTLLPMVRKFIGTVLVVLVTLVILSTLGIEIGPLLAGAGVIGLAIGFGAQKLVSDIFSGFFYLLDDAFRVGEYLQAGSVSGAVEAITLRNVMLRHHRGMLQIVPYSELGPITNFMRGGIVVKFNLEFPYDTDIDKVRKIIKKVGQSMLEDDEFKDDFIRPLKSQGVREITNSVMVIRVKFTAKPGTHFVIRREAYRRITEALAEKGIHYAHRKVIVEVPDSGPDTDKQKITEAGAAAGLAAMAEDEKKKSEEKGGS